MKKKVLLMTGIALVLLVAVVAAALNAVFTVSDVVVSYSNLSAQGDADAVALQKELDEAFVGKSTTFLKLEEVKEVVAKYPAFKLVSEPEKDYPGKILLSLKERKEAFAFRRADNGMFAVLDEDGCYLYDKETNINRRRGENILFDGFVLETTKSGDPVTGEFFDAALKLADVFLSELDDARANIVSITLAGAGSAVSDRYLVVKMQEGVTIAVFTPENQLERKAVAVLDKYLSLSDAERLYGYFDVVDLAAGGFTVSEHMAKPPVEM